MSDYRSEHGNRRLQHFDYSKSRFYFLTCCTHERQMLFGEISEGTMNLSAAGEMISALWTETLKKFPGTKSDIHVVMPNHFHAILFIPSSDDLLVAAAPVAADSRSDVDVVAAAPVAADSRSDVDVVAAAPVAADSESEIPFRRGQHKETVVRVMNHFKSITTHAIIRAVRGGQIPTFKKAVWQRSYHDHIIRNDESHYHICEYIRTNPVRWKEDCFHPEFEGRQPQGQLLQPRMAGKSKYSEK